MKSKNNNKDLTNGVIWKSIVLFALPLLGSAIVQQLYSTIDLIFVGRLIGKQASAAVGSSDLLITCLIGLFTGISVGAGVVSAQAFGAKDKRSLHRLIQTVFFFGIIGAAVLIVLGEIFAPTLLHLMDTPSDVFPSSIVYLRIYLLGAPAILLYNLCAGIVRSLGDSAATFRFQVIGGCINVGSDALFIAVFKMGVAGAAIATVIAQLIAAYFAIRYLCKLEEGVRLRFNEFLIDGRLLKKVLYIGVPAGIQSMIISFSNLFIQSTINSLGVNVMAAFAAYLKVEMFIYYPIVSFGQALVTYTAQNVGAGKNERVRKGLRITLVLGIVVTLVIAGLFLLAGKPIFMLFNKDPMVIEAALTIIHITFPLYFVYMFQESFGSVCKGLGQAVVPMVIIIVCMCGVRVTLLKVFTYLDPVVRSVAIVYPITWALAGVGMFIYYIHVVYRKKMLESGVTR